MGRETGCAGGDARDDLSFRPGQPAHRGQSWAPAAWRSSHVGGLCGWCCRAGGSPCRSRAGARRGPVPVARAPRAGCCPAGSAGCLPPPRARGGRARSSPPGGGPADLADCAAGISRRPGTPARCLAARAWRRPASAAGARTVSQLMPATGSGRDAIPDPAPEDRPAPPPGPPGGGMIPAQPSPAPSPPWPGSDGAAPGIPGAVGMAWRDWRCRAASASCGQPLVPTGPQDPARIFSNHTVLAGAPLRNRTVDLLLTMHDGSVR
jgi:hypothetical protein